MPAAVLVHELRAKARRGAVSPDRPAERRQPTGGLDARHPRERLGELAVFRLPLCGRRQVLQDAAAAYPEVRATRRDPRRGRFQHLEQLGVIVLSVAPRTPQADALPRQRARFEYGLAAAHHSLALVGERGDGGGLGGGLGSGGPLTGTHARQTIATV